MLTGFLEGAEFKAMTADKADTACLSYTLYMCICTHTLFYFLKCSVRDSK